jgi:hypothetical protein
MDSFKYLQGHNKSRVGGSEGGWLECSSCLYCRCTESVDPSPLRLSSLTDSSLLQFILLSSVAFKPTTEKQELSLFNSSLEFCSQTLDSKDSTLSWLPSLTAHRRKLHYPTDFPAALIPNIICVCYSWANSCSFRLVKLIKKV